jgi:hypothetical protein
MHSPSTTCGTHVGVDMTMGGGGLNLSPEKLGPKAFKSNVCDTRFSKHFRASNNIIKYDGKINPSV